MKYLKTVLYSLYIGLLLATAYTLLYEGKHLYIFDIEGWKFLLGSYMLSDILEHVGKLLKTIFVENDNATN